MSLIRLGLAHKIIASAKNIAYVANHVAPFARRQSTGTPSSGLTTWKALLYGMSTGLVIGGSLVYASYNPSFHNKADKYVPGFARLADFTADRWMDLSDTVKPTSVDRVGLKKDLGSQLDSLSHENDTKKPIPSMVDEKFQAKEDYSVKASDKDESMLRQTIEATTHEAVVQPPTLSTEEFINTATKYVTEPADGDSVQLAIKEESIDKMVAAESQPGILPEIAIVPVKSVDSSVSVEPDASVKGTVVSVKEVTTEEVIEIQSQVPLSAQGSEEHFQWLKDAAQAELLLQKVYDKFRGLDKTTCDMRKVLIQAEKHRQDKYAEAMRISTDNEALMQAIARDISEADEAVLSAKKNITLSQFETSEVGQELAYLLDRASDLGLKSKVEEIRQELSQLHTRAMMGTVDYAEIVSGSGVEEDPDEIEKVKDSELGMALPVADSQEAIILMLKKRVDMLLQKFEEAENDHQDHIADALLKQKYELERLAEKKLQLHLQEQEQKLCREAQKKATHEKEEELKQQLLMQATAHRQHLLDALHAQAEQLGAKWACQTEAQLTQQETHYQNELVKALAGLRGIRSMVDSIVNADERTRQQQSLRTACDTFCGSLEQADLITDPNGCYSYMKETVSLQEAAHGDYFILAVLDSIPQEAVNKRGIQSEAGLQQRFKKVKRVCKQVALIPETGGGLGTYAVSYLHYMLTFSHVDGEKYPIDMDTFELLQVADVLVEQGNIEGAIRLVNYLQGEPKRVAQDWLRDAQLYLETKQAVCLVQNYIASISLSIIH